MSQLVDLSGISEVVPIFQSAIDQVIEHLGKTCRLYFKPDVAESDDDNDFINMGGSRKPSFKDAAEDVLEPVYIDIKCLTEWINIKDEIVSVGVGLPESRCKIKTYITHFPDILRADYIVPAYDVVQYHGYRYRIDGDIQPLGLQEDRYAQVYLKRVINED